MVKKKGKRKTRPFGFWKSRSNVKGELKRVTKKLGHFPSWMDLRKIKEWALIQGIRNYHDDSITTFREEMGYEPRAESKPVGYWSVWRNMEGELESIMKELGRFPTDSDLRNLGRTDVISGTKHHGGLPGVREKMGYERPANFRMENYMDQFQEEFGEPLEEFLTREYQSNRRSIKKIASDVRVGERTISNWMNHFGIPVRTVSETKLPEGVTRPSRRQLNRWYTNDRRSSIKIGKEIGVSYHTVARWLREEGIPRRDNSERSMRPGSRKPTKTELRRDYVANHMNKNEMGEKYGVAGSTVNTWLIEHKIPIRGVSESGLPKGYKEPTRGQLEKWYTKERRSAEEIAGDLSISKNRVYKLLRKNKLSRNRTSEIEDLNPGKRKLKGLYLRQKQSPKTIGEQYGVSSTVVRKWLEEHEIPIRNISEARMSPGGERPSESQLRQWYVEREMTTVEIAERMGVSDVSIGLWLKDAGINPRDRRGIYDNKENRKKTMRDLLNHSGKKPKNISTADFDNTKREDGTAFAGLLNWYKRNHDCTSGEARDIILEELCGVPIGESKFHSRAKKTYTREYEKWDEFEKTIKKMFGEHPELEGKFPSGTWLNENQYTYINRAVLLHGGMNVVREKLGQSVLRRSSSQVKDFEYIRNELENIIVEHQELDGEFPGSGWLIDNGYSFVENAIRRHHGGPKSVSERMGYEVVTPVKTESQLISFLSSTPEAQEVAALTSITGSTSDIANMLVQMWPDRFPSASQLARSLPSAVKRIGYSLHPFSMDKIRGLYEKTKALPTEVRYVLDDLLFNIAVDQYQTRFNEDPEGTLKELGELSKSKNGIRKLAKRVHDTYREVYTFNIPGHGKLRDVA